MMRALILKGDPTSHGGEVLEGNEFIRVNGRPVAQRGHMTSCPQCGGEFPIVEGLRSHGIGGIGAALEGMKTGCGAELIATTTAGCMLLDDGAGKDGG
jgi:uncharacterized Zn-binding protein involved in type VI secretion